jgi:hypothetical protein
MSIPNLLAALIISAAVVIGAGIGVTSIRLPGASLDPSLQNEADRAVRQSAAWIASRQNPDGSWGVSNHVSLTSLALLSLSASRQPGFSEATTRAVLWLDAHATNRVVDLSTHAWRLLALVQSLPATGARSAALRRFSEAGRPFEANAPSDVRHFWRESLAAAGLETASLLPMHDASNRVAGVAASWPPATSSTATLWQLAHFINREANGQLLHDNTPLDWRSDLAQRLVNAQRSAPSGGGYWEATEADATLAETAFGLLSLLEL